MEVTVAPVLEEAEDEALEDEALEDTALEDTALGDVALEEAMLEEGWGLGLEMPNWVVSVLKVSIGHWISMSVGKRTLILPVRINDQLNPIMGNISLKIGRRSPRVAASVRNLLDDSVERLDVGGRSTQQDESDGALGRGRPGDHVRRANRDYLVETGPGYWVAGGSVADWGRVGGGEGRQQGGEDEGCAHFGRLYWSCRRMIVRLIA